MFRMLKNIDSISAIAIAPQEPTHHNAKQARKDVASAPAILYSNRFRVGRRSKHLDGEVLVGVRAAARPDLD